MRARVPNFAKASSKSANNQIDNNNSTYVSNSNLNKALKEKEQIGKRMLAHQTSLNSLHQNSSNSNLYHHHLHHSASHNMLPHQQQPSYMWHARSYESGIGEYDQF